MSSFKKSSFSRCLPVSRRKHLLLLAVPVILLGVVYLTRTQTVVYGYDPLGYLYAGQRLAQGAGLSFPDVNNALAGAYFAPFAFNVARSGDPNLFLNYPPGLPLLLALAQMLTRAASAPYFVTPLAGIVGILATYWLGKQLFGDVGGLIAAVLLGLSPLYFTFSTDLWSDIPATTLLSLALALFVSSLSASTRHGVVKAALAGLLLGYAVFIRYSVAVLVLPPTIYGLMISVGSIPARRRLLSFLVAFGLVMSGLLLFNRSYYGGFLATAYSPKVGWYPWPAFSPAYTLGPSPVGGRSMVGAFQTLLRDLPLALPLSILGFLIMKRASAVLLGGTVLMVLGLYSCYAFAPTGINARFLLPAIPMICLASAVGLERIGGYLGAWRPARILLPITIIVLSVFLFRPALAAVEQRASGTQAQIAYVQRMTEATPTDAVFMSYVYNDLISYYGGRSVLNYRRIPPADAQAGRYKMEILEPCLVAVIGKLLDAGRPVYYVEDKSPPFWDSLAILQRHFMLQLTQHDPKVYQVLAGTDKSGWGELARCGR